MKKSNSIDKLNPKIIEIWGLFILLFASFWQIYFSEQIMKFPGDMDNYRIRQKLDTIWLYITRYENKDANKNFDEINDLKIQYGDTYNDKSNYLQFAGYDRVIRMLLFLLGSLMILLSKIIELKKSKKITSRC